jgi:hypothetical protein
MTKSSQVPAIPQAKKGFSLFWMILLTAIFVIGSYGTYMFAVSPPQIRKPVMEHYHFRMQVVVDGKAENFGQKQYQQGYSKDQCNANLVEQPIHFHDNKDQFVHIHWSGMTGGMVLKYYGWNYIGGMDNALGYKLDDLADIQKVTIHGDYLPSLPKDHSLYVYVGDEHGYTAKKFADFIHQDLEQFFGKPSNFPDSTTQSSLLNKIFPKASAHGAEKHDEPTHTETDEERLTRINNLVGNVVIFAQKETPTAAQIQDRFNRLEPLSESTCGG